MMCETKNYDVEIENLEKIHGVKVVGIVREYRIDAPLNKTKYKVTLTDDVSMEELCRGYEVISMEGEVFTIKRHGI